MRTIVIENYNDNWRREFERIRDFLMPHIADLVLDVVHVGSTSVAGLAAKPIIDFDIVIESYEIFPALVERLGELGYVHDGDGDISQRERFRREYPDEFMAYHMYVCPKDSKELKRHLTLRDYLRENAEAVKAYGELKNFLPNNFVTI